MVGQALTRRCPAHVLERQHMARTKSAPATESAVDTPSVPEPAPSPDGAGIPHAYKPARVAKWHERGDNPIPGNHRQSESWFDVVFGPAHDDQPALHEARKEARHAPKELVESVRAEMLASKDYAPVAAIEQALTEHREKVAACEAECERLKAEWLAVLSAPAPEDAADQDEAVRDRITKANELEKVGKAAHKQLVEARNEIPASFMHTLREQKDAFQEKLKARIIERLDAMVAETTAKAQTAKDRVAATITPAVFDWIVADCTRMAAEAVRRSDLRPLCRVK